MAQGLIKVLLFYSGKGLVALGYGQKGMAAREKLGKSANGLAYAFGTLFFVWLFFGVFFYFMFRGSADSIISLVTMIVCPAIYAIWFLFARRSAAKLIEESGSLEEAR